jgi:GDP-L-fucose synthase
VDAQSRIYVAGGSTLIGRALVERLQATGHENLSGLVQEPDLTCPGQVEDFFAEYRPEYVFLTAGLSGGIRANQLRPAEFLLDNLLTNAHVIHQAHLHGATRLLYLASSCIYPRQAPQPLHPASLLTGPLEPTNDAYATAKITGWKLCEAYRQQYGADFFTAIPTNAFGPGDDFSPESGHVIPALMRRMHEARQRGDDVLNIWGSGRPIREFLFAPDLADACLFVMKHNHNCEPINLGGQTALSIAETARLIAEVVGYKGTLRFDAQRPDGMPCKTLDSSRLRELGWQPPTDFRTALAETYRWFLEQNSSGQEVAYVGRLS